MTAGVGSCRPKISSRLCEQDLVCVVAFKSALGVLLWLWELVVRVSGGYF